MLSQHCCLRHNSCYKNQVVEQYVEKKCEPPTASRRQIGTERQNKTTHLRGQRTGIRMRRLSQIAAVSFVALVHAAGFARGFQGSFASTSSPRVPRALTRSSSVITMGPAPGLWKRKLPNTLGSWRVESVVDSEEPNSMFVFLFDDGSGEGFVGYVDHFCWS